MPAGGPNSERILILAPRGRDAQVAAKILQEAGLPTRECEHIACLCDELKKGAALAVVADEAFVSDDLTGLAEWIRAQPPWSDFPFVLLTVHGDSPNRTTVAARFQTLLSNVTFLERPFHPTTLVSVARAALQSRRRQYDARELLERYELLARELQHRSKNMLAIIQSIASASLSDGPERAAFFGRLHAIADAQDLLMEGEQHGAPMKDVVARALRSFSDRVHMEGVDVYLNARAAQGFALIVHELATNASKYGSLATNAGTVSVQWTVEGNSGSPVITFRWRERGGPPVKPPARKGFGSLLLEHAVAHVGDPPRVEYAEGGFSYELRAGFAAVSALHSH